MKTSLLLLSLALGGVAADDDICNVCQAQIAALQTTWENATTVDEILASLEDECKAKYPRQPGKVSLCDDVAKVFVQIPPGIFSGLETLAWPIPLGVCASIGKCEVACCDAGAGPEQIHLSLSGFGDQSRMGVSWADLNGQTSQVEWRLAGGDGNTSSATGDVVSYPDGAGYAHYAAGWVGSLHRAVMVGLASETAYQYRVASSPGPGGSGGGGGDGDLLWSDWVEFRTLPSAEIFQADPSKSLRFAVLGDMGYGPLSDASIANLAALVDAGQLDAVIHSGDESYADGFMPHWDAFLNKIQPIASRVPYMVTPGNHELWYNFSAYKARFMMPGVGPFEPSPAGDPSSGSGDNMYYEWGVPGLVHFAACDSETALDTANFGVGQLAWMDEILGTANSEAGRASAPWSLVHFHRPLFCSGSSECNSPNGMAQILRTQGEPLFLEHQVDVIFEAHIHSYERSFPMANWTATQHDYTSPGAPVYVVQGASGNREGNSGFPAEPPDWSAGRSSAVGFGVLEVSRASLGFTFFASNATAGPQALDAFAIAK